MRNLPACLAGSLMLAVMHASAATIVVTSLGDAAGTCPNASTCTLRTALASAIPNDRIEFSASFVLPATITLAVNELVIDRSLVIAGPGADRLVVVAAPNRRALSLTSGTVAIEGIALVGGRAGGFNGASALAGSGQSGGAGVAAEGGCIRTSAATSLALDGVAIRDCEARAGNGGAGGSGAAGSPPGNGGNGGFGGAARGGAILALGQLTLANSSVQQSFALAGAGGDGGAGGNGGVFSSEGTGGGGGNAGVARGGAVFVETGGALLVRNSTFVANGAIARAGGRGGNGGDGFATGIGIGGAGGIGGNASGGQMFLATSLALADIEFAAMGPATIAAGPGGMGGNGNPNGPTGANGVTRGEVYFSDHSARVRASLLIGAAAAADCFGLVQDQGSNADSDNSCAGFALQGTFAANFRSGAIDEERGRAVLLPLPGSFSIDAAASCNDIAEQPVLIDQSGRTRPLDGNFDGTATCDVGAIEFDPRLFSNGFEP